MLLNSTNAPGLRLRNLSTGLFGLLLGSSLLGGLLRGLLGRLLRGLRLLRRALRVVGVVRVVRVVGVVGDLLAAGGLRGIDAALEGREQVHHLAGGLLGGRRLL